jgi:hypothetical protein
MDTSKPLLGEYISINESWPIRALLKPARWNAHAEIGGKNSWPLERLPKMADRFSCGRISTGVSSALSLDLATRSNAERSYARRRGGRDYRATDATAFVSNESGVDAPSLDTQSGKELRAPKLPLGVISSTKWHANNRDLLSV